MINIHEKILYENDKGDRVEISYNFPFFFQRLEGQDGLNAIIAKTKGQGQDGTTIEDVTLSDRALQIQGIIKGQSKSELAQSRQKLLKVFNPRIGGWLYYEYGNVKKKIYCNVENAPKFARYQESFKRQSFLINLICSNSYWQDNKNIKTGIAYWSNLFEFPLEIPESGLEMGTRANSLIVNVKNNGDVECGMTLEFKASATVVNPIIININTQEYIKINKTMQAGEIITINTHFNNKTVTSFINGIKSNAFNYFDLNSTFMQLYVGDNLFRYDSEENINNLEVNIYYSPQYLGV